MSKNQFHSDQILDTSVVEEPEWKSIGLAGAPYSPNLNVSVVDGGTKKVTLSSGDLDNPRVQDGDWVVIAGNTGADGTYTVASILNELEFFVVETITSGTGGTSSFYYPSGASKEGFDNSTNGFVSTTTQGAIEEVVSGVGFSGYIKFGSNSTAGSGKWLEIHRNVTSNDRPFVAPKPIKLLGASASTNNTSITFGIYKNGSQIDTLVITSNTKVSKVLDYQLVLEDEISIKIESGSAQDPLVFLVFK